MADRGRPSSYSEEILNKAKEYLECLPEDEVVHSKEGLSLYIGVSRETIYTWCKEKNEDGTLKYPEFLDIVEQVFAKQGKTLVNKGLENKFNSSITKVMLTKHEYREGIEQTGKDGKDLIPDTLTKEEKEKLLSILDDKRSSE